ncbi:Dps family protein [Salipaludibacillus sp. HK11]|uniref:Dps family protein n=1 Tax=Salipaludibacillus sp. HK11 TaxID=3394320 RepID=UPI0039FC3CF5
MAHEKTAEILNRQVANWNVMFVKLHNFHWYVKGPNFFTLHEKFEELYDEAAGHIDELAERLLTLKGKPVASMKEFLTLTTLEEAKGELASEEMVKALIEDFTRILTEIKEDVSTLEEDVDDQGTADMLLEISHSLEKHNWMFRTFLGE